MAKSMRQVALAELEQDDDPPPVKKSGKKLVVFDLPTHDDDDEEDNPPPQETKKNTKAKRVELVDVELGGKKYKVDKEAVAAIQELSSQGGASKGLLDEVRRISAELEGAKKKTSKKKDDEEQEQEEENELELFTDTKKFLKKFEDKIRKAVTTELTSKYEGAESNKTFWAEFYSGNKDLREERRLVESILNEHMETLGNMKKEEGMKKLADLTRAELLRIAKKHGRPAPRKDHTEGAGSNRSTREEQDESEEEDTAPETISALLRQRKQNRRNAATNHVEE